MRAQAVKAEAVIRAQMFEKRYGLTEKPECRFDKFVEETFKPHKKLKKSYRYLYWTEQAVLRGREVGRDEWKKEAGYHRRSLAERR
jgi:hypothetical protein